MIIDSRRNVQNGDDDECVEDGADKFCVVSTCQRRETLVWFLTVP